MRLRLSAAGFWRFPEARAMRSDAGWAVELGKDHQAVLPLGVDAAPGYARSEPLAESLHEIHEELRKVALYEGEEAARKLAEHCQQYPAPLLCLDHGWPAGHPGECSDHDLAPDGPWLVSVDHVVAMVTGLDGVRDLAYYLATQRKPARKALVENALAWPILEAGWVRMLRGELERDNGELWVGRARQVVTLTMTEAMRLSGLNLLLEWLPNAGPSLALEAQGPMGAYVADFVRHIGASATADRSTTCAVCGQPYTPRRTPQPGAGYCTSVECQRERRRINKARQRARTNSQEGQGNG